MHFSGHHWHEDWVPARCCQCGDYRREDDLTQPVTCRGANARVRARPRLRFSWEERRAS